MVTPLRTPNPLIFASCGLLMIVLAAAPKPLLAQADAYNVAIVTDGKGPVIGGFLYAVNDTAVVVLPRTKGGPKGVLKALQSQVPISIPVHLIKRVHISKVRTFAHGFTAGFLISLGYAVAYLAVVPITNPIGLVPYTIAVTGLSLLTVNLIYVKKFRPTEPGFTVLMQKYCLKKSGLMVDR